MTALSKNLTKKRAKELTNPRRALLRSENRGGERKDNVDKKKTTT
jgi:hypothetical protein